MTDTIDLLLDAVQEVYGEKTPNEALRPPFIEHVEQARADEREKVLSEVDEAITKRVLPAPLYGNYKEDRLHQRWQAVLNQLKGTEWVGVFAPNGGHDPNNPYPLKRKE